jgi:hypothetical protein
MEKKVKKITYRKYPKCGELVMLTMQVSNCGKLEIMLRNMADPGHGVVNYTVYNSPSREIQVIHVSNLQNQRLKQGTNHI